MPNYPSPAKKDLKDEIHEFLSATTETVQRPRSMLILTVKDKLNDPSSGVSGTVQRQLCTCTQNIEWKCTSERTARCLLDNLASLHKKHTQWYLMKHNHHVLEYNDSKTLTMPGRCATSLGKWVPRFCTDVTVYNDIPLCMLNEALQCADHLPLRQQWIMILAVKTHNQMNHAWSVIEGIQSSSHPFDVVYS